MPSERAARALTGGATALIGYSGFVGQNLDRQAQFTERFRSTDIESMAGRHYDLVVCAGAPGVKWKANQDPDADRASLDRLTGVLARVHATRLVLISTVDVYPTPVGVDELTDIPPVAGSAYGRHRLDLERFLTARFDTITLRLPGLFGDGLRKNLIFDLLSGNTLAAVNPASTFQFYPLDHLWQDIQRVMDAGCALVNFATEPIRVAEIARDAFGQSFDNPSAPPAIQYDMRTVHADLWHRTSPYLLDKRTVMDEMTRFVAAQRARPA